MKPKPLAGPKDPVTSRDGTVTLPSSTSALPRGVPASFAIENRPTRRRPAGGTVSATRRPAIFMDCPVASFTGFSSSTVTAPSDFENIVSWMSNSVEPEGTSVPAMYR